MMEQEMNKELLSALVDGELHGEELEQALACAESAEGCASWEIYHLVGDVLRSPDLAHHSQHDLLSGLREKLAQEPPPLQLASSQLQQVATGLAQSDARVVPRRTAPCSAGRWLRALLPWLPWQRWAGICWARSMHHRVRSLRQRLQASVRPC